MTTKNKQNSVDPLFPEASDPVRGTSGLAVPSTAPSVRVLDDNVSFHANESFVSWAKLIQNTNDFLGPPGNFFIAETEEIFDELLLVPIKIVPTRTLWPAGGFSRGQGPECASADGIRPVESFFDGTLPLMAGTICAECQFFSNTPWLARPGEQVCAPGYVAYGLDPNTFEIIGLRLSGTSARVAKIMGRANVCGTQIVRLCGTKRTGDKGSWYQLQCVALGEITAEQKSVIGELQASFKPANPEIH